MLKNGLSWTFDERLVWIWARNQYSGSKYRYMTRLHRVYRVITTQWVQFAWLTERLWRQLESWHDLNQIQASTKERSILRDALSKNCVEGDGSKSYRRHEISLSRKSDMNRSIPDLLTILQSNYISSSCNIRRFDIALIQSSSIRPNRSQNISILNNCAGFAEEERRTNRLQSTWIDRARCEGGGIQSSGNHSSISATVTSQGI